LFLINLQSLQSYQQKKVIKQLEKKGNKFERTTGRTKLGDNYRSKQYHRKRKSFFYAIEDETFRLTNSNRRRAYCSGLTVEIFSASEPYLTDFAADAVRFLTP
jgi:hypothetical protein